MAVAKLTEKMVERTAYAKIGQAQIEISDVQSPHLVLKIGRQSKTFFWRGRDRLRKRMVVKLGVFPDLDLEGAREESIRVSGLVRQGVDPRLKDREGMTGSDLLDGFCDHPMFTDLTEGGQRNYKGYLNSYFLKVCGDMPIQMIHSGHLMDVIEMPDRKGHRTAARLTHVALSRMFKFAILKRLLEMNPMYGIPAPKKPLSRNRVLDSDELKLAWHAVQSESRPRPQATVAIKLLMLLPFRRSELLLGRWSEIDFEAGLWTLPASRIKTRGVSNNQFLMPLPPLALTILESMREQSKSKFIFPNLKGEQMNPKILTRFVSRNLTKGAFEGMERWTLHDLRRTIATGMGMLGVDEHIISRCLNHSAAGVTARVYNLHSYRDKKLEALIMWENHLKNVVS